MHIIMVELYGFRVDNIEGQIPKVHLSLLHQDIRQRVEKYRYIEDKKRTVYGRLLATHLASENLNINYRDVIINNDEFGKPYVLGFPNFHFNISHSGNWVVCAISDKKIGIDIEKILPIELNIAKRFFSNSEYVMIMSQPESRRIDYFYEIWTLKESYVKYIGKGLSIPLRSFSVSDNHNYIVGDINACLSTIHMCPNYKLSICSEYEITSNVILKYIDADFFDQLW